MPFGPKEPRVRWGSDPIGMGNFQEGEGMPGHLRRHSAVNAAKTAEAIEMPFGLWTWVGPKKHVLDGSADPPWEGTVFRGKNIPGYPKTFYCELCNNG